jgi:7-cyano-7-deazaguanine synthase
MAQEDLLILFSGGFDSRLLLELAIEMDWKPYCLLVHYGQVHSEELTAAINVCARENIPYTSACIGLSIQSKLVDGTTGVYEGVSEWYVPARNLMFIGLAASIAESKGIKTIWYGANYDDRENLFPDCYQEWVYSVNQLLSKNGSFPITLEAPLLGMKKYMIEMLAKKYNITKQEVFSGYRQQ